MKLTSCKACGARIFFAATATSERMPIDHLPSRDGNLSVTFTAPLPTAVVVTPGQAAGMRAAGLQLYRSHFAQCPNADEYRRRARAKSTTTNRRRR